MKIVEIINPARLYHGTTVARLAQIKDLGRVLASNVDRGPPGVSLTRDLRTAQEKANNRGHQDGSGGAVLVFDRDRLARQFGRRLQPIDVLGIRGSDPNNPFTGATEYEERVVAPDIPAGLISSVLYTNRSDASQAISQDDPISAYSSSGA